MAGIAVSLHLKSSYAIWHLKLKGFKLKNPVCVLSAKRRNQGRKRISFWKWRAALCRFDRENQKSVKSL